MPLEQQIFREYYTDIFRHSKFYPLKIQLKSSKKAIDYKKLFLIINNNFVKI
ncbi:hypothetical protein PB1E_0608 [Leuconostoc gelidum subsp. gasicomitatum]|nr:hypothetical protein PB1E_0608 [Leuconostoc gasicomitatum]